MNFLITNTACRVTKAEIAIAREMDSLRIKGRRTWCRYSEGICGDAITFLQRFENKSFPEAAEYLLSYQGRARDPPEQLRLRRQGQQWKTQVCQQARYL